MEKRSSMRNSGLDSLFRSTEARAGMSAEARGEQSGEGAHTSPTSEPDHVPDSSRQLIQPSRTFPAVIRVVGVGGGGVNAINRMLEARLEGVEFVAINTDVQALQMCEADHKLRIGRELTKGLGGGSDPQVGRDSALTAYDEIKGLLKGSDMVFITAGEGGGTGTGAAPVIAEIARSVGALTIGVVSRPFAFEGKRRQAQASEGIDALRRQADTVIVVPNDKLLEVVDRTTSMVDALRVADDVLRQGVQGICDLVTVPGLINLDLADVRTIMTGAGTAHMGIGQARGEERAQKAAAMAINSSLLETSIDGARGILLNVSGGSDLSLFEVNEVAEAINGAADPEANIIFGAVIDEALGDALRVTVVATGFEAGQRPRLEVVGKDDVPPGVGTPADTSRPGDSDGQTSSNTSEDGEAAQSHTSTDDELEVPGFLRSLDDERPPDEG
jgi:cell division protein FtsZ